MLPCNEGRTATEGVAVLFILLDASELVVVFVRNAAEEAAADNTASTPPGLIDLWDVNDTGLPSPVPVETYPSRLTKT